MYFRYTLTVFLPLGLLVAFASAGVGQVLTPPEKTEVVATKAVSIEGVVSEQKKYSFRVKTGDKEFVVKPTANAIFTLRMNKPIYDFTNHRVRVLKSISAFGSQLDSAKKPGRVTFDLPQQLYVISRFDNPQQMERVMGQKVKRINNYLLASQHNGDVHPNESQMLIGGQLTPGGETTVANLKIEDKTYSVMLGHRNASMTGFSIIDLKPLATEVFVWGNSDSEGNVLANRIEFRPIEPIKE